MAIVSLAFWNKKDAKKILKFFASCKFAKVSSEERQNNLIFETFYITETTNNTKKRLQKCIKEREDDWFVS